MEQSWPEESKECDPMNRRQDAECKEDERGPIQWKSDRELFISVTCEEQQDIKGEETFVIVREERVDLIGSACFVLRRLHAMCVDVDKDLRLIVSLVCASCAMAKRIHNNAQCVPAKYW